MDNQIIQFVGLCTVYGNFWMFGYKNCWDIQASDHLKSTYVLPLELPLKYYESHLWGKNIKRAVWQSSWILYSYYKEKWSLLHFEFLLIFQASYNLRSTNVLPLNIFYDGAPNDFWPLAEPDLGHSPGHPTNKFCISNKCAKSHAISGIRQVQINQYTTIEHILWFCTDFWPSAETDLGHSAHAPLLKNVCLRPNNKCAKFHVISNTWDQPMYCHWTYFMILHQMTFDIQLSQPRSLSPGTLLTNAA